jgi:glycosyltransferase involved in cell wall biosynthesis
VKILLVMDPLIPVPPVHYGGIERVVADLANGLVRRGHDVTLWAGPGSHTDAPVLPFGRQGEWSRWSNVRNVATLTRRFLADGKRFDVIHNFGRLAYLLAVLRSDVAKVQTYMRPVNAANMRWVTRLGGRRMHYTAVSAAIRDTGAPGGGAWSVIYNCAPVRQFDFRPDTDPATAPLVFLGRLERCKGAHTAIEVARRLNRTLLIAGNIVEQIPREKQYFEQELKPRFDGKLIRYLGTVNNREKSDLLGGAAAMLLPIEWEEPFPIVLPEALACGTPVIAFRRGGVPEGIEHGVTGFVCDSTNEMAACVQQLGDIRRAACRAEAERRFSDDAIVAEYERLYQELVRAAS